MDDWVHGEGLLTCSKCGKRRSMLYYDSSFGSAGQCKECRWPIMQVSPTTGTVSEVGRYPELRRAALEVVCRMERWHAGGTDDDFEQLGKAMDALKEALAK